MATKPSGKDLRSRPLSFSYGLRSFLGYLEGSQKAEHTIQNYRLDLLSFQKFLLKQQGLSASQLGEVQPRHLEAFHHFLKAQGLKTNTRRRKLLTIRRFLSYLSRRKRLPEELDRKQLAPGKMERVPVTVALDRLLEAIQRLPALTEFERRNRALLWILAETGCLVSEASQLRFDQWSEERIEFKGKSPRKVPISRALAQALSELKGQSKGSGSAFQGYNRFGSMGTPITPRGIEMLVKAHASKLGLGALTPRTFRHSVAIDWLKRGISRSEIQARLGLKSAYAFRVYEPILKETTS